MSEDRYIRTTETEHEKTAQWIFQRADDAGDIYLHQYEGWYVATNARVVNLTPSLSRLRRWLTSTYCELLCVTRYNVREERFVADAEAEQMGFKDEHGRPFERQNEASYHFRMSKYQERLVEHIKTHPEFIQARNFLRHCCCRRCRCCFSID